jgi:hypothetical protein
MWLAWWLLIFGDWEERNRERRDRSAEILPKEILDVFFEFSLFKVKECSAAFDTAA